MLVPIMLPNRASSFTCPVIRQTGEGGTKGRRGEIQEGQARGAATVCDASARWLSIALSCPEMLALTAEKKSAQK